jgi:hypothetical protein
MYLIRDEADNLFLVPDLLPKDGPKLDFNGIPAFEYAIRDGRGVAPAFWADVDDVDAEYS